MFDFSQAFRLGAETVAFRHGRGFDQRSPVNKVGVIEAVFVMELGYIIGTPLATGERAADHPWIGG
jgi:hypothetical protein